MVAYRDILWAFCWTFVLFSLILWPQMSILSQGTGFAQVPDMLKGYGATMLGNLGYSTL